MGMDSRTGHFAPIEGGLFEVGERVKLKNVEFRIESFHDDRLELRTMRSIEMEPLLGDMQRDFSRQIEERLQRLAEKGRDDREAWRADVRVKEE